MRGEQIVDPAEQRAREGLARVVGLVRTALDEADKVARREDISESLAGLASDMGDDLERARVRYIEGSRTQ